MKKILALLGFVLAVQMMAWAQGPSFNFSSAVNNTNEEVCVKVTVRDFSDITSLKFPIRWDSTVLEFKEVRPTAVLPGLDVSDFDSRRSKSGLLFLNWSPGPCSSANSITKNDGEIIFEVCFKIIGKYGQSTTIGLSEDRDFIGDINPIIINRYFSGPIGDVCTPIGYNQGSIVGDVSVGVRPIRLFASEATGSTGETVFLNVKVSGFDKLTSFQFSMNYDTTLLEFNNVIPQTILPNLSANSFGRPNDASGNIAKGNLTVSWSIVEPQGISLADSTTIFQVFFKIIGPCGSGAAPVVFSDVPTKKEAINTVREGEIIPILGITTHVNIAPCNPPGLKLLVNCGEPVQINQEVCSKVIAPEGMDRITTLNFLTEWNANTLQYTRLTNVTTKIPGFTPAFFNTTNTTNGILGLNWTAAGNFSATLAPGDVLFEVCFKAIGLSGTLSPNDTILEAPVQLNGTTATIIKRGELVNMGLAPRNCEVQIIQPPGVRIVLSAGNGKPGDEICTNVTVGNFKNVIHLQYSLTWEPADISFTSVKNLNTTALPGLSLASHFDIVGAAGSFTFDYTSPNPLTVTDGTVIFQVCYNITGKSPGELGTQDNCDNNIEIVSQPLSAEAILSTSNGKNVGIIGAPTNICILNPTGFFLLMGQNKGYLKDTVCVDFRVQNFNKVTSTQFKVNWPTGLKFVKATPSTNLAALNLDTRSANVGLLAVDFNDLVGKSLLDSTVIFTMCFELIGAANECFKIDINNAPNPSVTTVDGVGSVFPKAGEVCIQDTILIVDTVIVNATCPGQRNGTITIKRIGGTEDIFHLWKALDQNAGTVPLQFGEKAINLPAGRVELSTFDSRKPKPILRIDTFTVGENTIVPNADAGRDTIKGCIGALRLNAKGSTGPDFSYNWSALSGSISGTTDRIFTIVDEPGKYVFTVLDKKTGCFNKDTIQVSNATVPTADAGNNLFLDCKGDTLRLNGSKSSKGPSIKYKWSGPVGTTIDPSEINSINPKATSAGFYELEVRDTLTRCFAKDTIEVKNAQTRPDANAGVDLLLGCKGDPVTLDASKSQNNSPAVIYEWLDATNTIISRALKFNVTALGTYRLRIVDEANGCLDIDTVLVKPSLDYPSIKGAKDTDISCKTDKPILTTSVSNAPQFRAKWTSTNGGQIQAGTDSLLNAVVTAPGTYFLAVTNVASSCVSQDTVVVKVNKNTPTADAGTGGTLTCTVPSLSLSSTIGGSQNLRITWSRAGQVVAKDSTKLRVTTAGTYRLVAMDTLSGCSAIDSVVVDQKGELPQVNVNNVAKITCKAPSITLTANVSPASGTYRYAWTTTGGTIVSGGNTVSSNVRGAGTYSLKVTNTSTGCVGEGLAQVVADTIVPRAQAGPDQTLSCKADTLTLNGTGSGTGTKISYTWSAKKWVDLHPHRPMHYKPKSLRLEYLS